MIKYTFYILSIVVCLLIYFVQENRIKDRELQINKLKHSITSLETPGDTILKKTTKLQAPQKKSLLVNVNPKIPNSIDTLIADTNIVILITSDDIINKGIDIKYTIFNKYFIDSIFINKVIKDTIYQTTPENRQWYDKPLIWYSTGIITVVSILKLLE